ncbi:MAG: MTH1187 family thiamine-binding protein [Phycisphaerae bacterium]|nr:MTH1187 family thiamine-binding protein [Phycisphaerae bacterium]
MSPLDKGESVSTYVARSLEIVSQSGLPYRLNPMGTVLEGEWDECMEVVRQCHARMSQDCNRITCSIRIDARKGRTGRLESKIAKVEQLVGKKLS